jgi:hypothetical protein
LTTSPVNTSIDRFFANPAVWMQTYDLMSLLLRYCMLELNLQTQPVEESWVVGKKTVNTGIDRAGGQYWF